MPGEEEGLEDAEDADSVVDVPEDGTRGDLAKEEDSSEVKRRDDVFL